MKKTPILLIIKILILGLPLYALVLYTWLFPMNYMPVEYSMWQQEKDYTISGPEADILILGDSRAKSSLIPEMLTDGDKEIYNMAIGGATPIEMYYALSRYLINHNAPERVIVIFAPYHLCEIDNWGQTETYHYLSSREMMEVYSNAKALDETHLLNGSLFDNLVSYNLRLPNKYMSSLYNAHFFGRYADNISKYNDVSKNLGYTEFGTDNGCDSLNYETHHTWFDDSKLVVMYYRKLVELCVDNNIYVQCIQAPINEASSEKIINEFWNGHKDVLRTVVYENLSDDVMSFETKVPVYDNKYFGDANHLNRLGAEKFTKKIKKKYFQQ